MSIYWIVAFLASLSFLQFCYCGIPPKDASTKSNILQKIKGTVEVKNSTSDDWMSATKVCLDEGKYCGFLDSSGAFVIHNVPPGSYVVEVFSPNYEFQSVRVDISSKNGKVRARHVNLLDKYNVTLVKYPLVFSTDKQAPFFEEKVNVILKMISEDPKVNGAWHLLAAVRPWPQIAT